MQRTAISHNVASKNECCCENGESFRKVELRAEIGEHRKVLDPIVLKFTWVVRNLDVGIEYLKKYSHRILSRLYVLSTHWLQ